jgi:GTP cyclohydrolase I
MIDRKKLGEAARLILAALPENVAREGLVGTPARVARDWPELFDGYEKDPAVILSKTFPAENYDEIIIREEIVVASFCEHHILPFRGKAWVGYLPDERIVGLDKIDKLVFCFAHRLQNQERLTVQVADAMMDYIECRGVMVVIKALHDCMRLRGIKSEKGLTTTSAIRGVFADPPPGRNPREEFLKLTGLVGGV